MIWNPRAGYKAGISTNRGGSEAALRDLMKRHGLGDELIATQSDEDAIAAVKDARDAGYEAVVAAGGDGTVGLVAKHLLKSRTALGILPLGSVMNIARSLGIPRDDLEAAAEIISAGETRAIDVGDVGGEPFFEAGSVGMNAAVFKEVQRVDEGDVMGIFRAIYVAFRWRPAHVRVKMDSGTRNVRALMIVVSVGAYTGAGFTVAPNARLDDGRFDINVFRHYSKLELIRHFASIAFGRRSYSPHTRAYRSKRVRIDGRRPLPARADSRDLGTTPVEFLCLPRVLTVLAPVPVPGGPEPSATQPA